MITEQMEGNDPTGAMFILQFIKLRPNFQARKNTISHSDTLYPILAAMIVKLQGYLDKALAWKIIVIATLLHPEFWHIFFERFFDKTSSPSINAELTFNRLFNDYQLQSTQKSLQLPLQISTVIVLPLRQCLTCIVKMRNQKKTWVIIPR